MIEKSIRPMLLRPKPRAASITTSSSVLAGDLEPPRSTSAAPLQVVRTVRDWCRLTGVSPQPMLMKRTIVVAALLLQISGFAAYAGAQTAQTAAAPKCELWYRGVLRDVMPLAIVLDAVGSQERTDRYEGVSGAATL